MQKQLKLRKQLEKELPRAERELKGVLSQWEEDHERHFIVLDTRFLDLLEQQIEERSCKKESEKMKKVYMCRDIICLDHSCLQKKDKEEALMFEMTYGSKPSTPIKRYIQVHVHVIQPCGVLCAFELHSEVLYYVCVGVVGLVLEPPQSVASVPSRGELVPPRSVRPQG